MIEYVINAIIFVLIVVLLFVVIFKYLNWLTKFLENFWDYYFVKKKEKFSIVVLAFFFPFWGLLPTLNADIGKFAIWLFCGLVLYFIDVTYLAIIIYSSIPFVIQVTRPRSFFENYKKDYPDKKR